MTIKLITSCCKSFRLSPEEERCYENLIAFLENVLGQKLTRYKKAKLKYQIKRKQKAGVSKK